jgi:16S rRNA (cytidine1402-2'-O)-methyltransferase
MNVPAVINSGQLIVGSMPIGNYDDITIRMVNAMRDCDIVFSDNLPTPIEELLKIYDLEKEIIVLKSTNTQYADQDQVDHMVDLIINGKKVLLVASEGQVGIADPGNQFIQACISKELAYTILPGPSAFMNAFVSSGITNGDFFVSCNMFDPKTVIDRFINQSIPLIILVWQNKLEEILLGITTDKKITLACDMTMKTEMFLHGTAKEILSDSRYKTIKENTKIAFVLHDH